MKIPGLLSCSTPLLLGVSAAFLLAASPGATQETWTIRGRVESSVTREALAGVRVTVQGEELEAISAENGEFVLSGVSSGALHLSLELPPDFVTTIEEVEVRPGITIRALFQMEPVSVILEELLVRRRPAPSDALVRTYAAGEARDITGGGTAVDLLAASFAGVQVVRGTGQAGAGSRILIRGVNSLILPGDPLVYLDGIRVNDRLADARSEAGVVLGFLDSIPADAIIRIELLKGPSATHYGIGSSNGVILLYTR